MERSGGIREHARRFFPVIQRIDLRTEAGVLRTRHSERRFVFFGACIEKRMLIAVAIHRGADAHGGKRQAACNRAGQL
jgi:hypothetical protein